MIPCGLSSSLPFQRRAKACFRDARSIFHVAAGWQRHGRGAGRHKSGDCVPARRVKRTGSAGCGTGTQIISTGTVFQCAPTAADPAAAAGANLRKLGLNGMFSGRRIGDLAVKPSTGQKLVAWGCAVGAAVFLYSKLTSRSQTASSQFFVRRCAPRAAVFLYSKRGSRCMAENFYQLALRTPGIWPLYASSRKQIRQMP